MNNSAIADQIKSLGDKVKSSEAPQELKDKILIRLDQLTRLVDSPTFLPEFDRINNYIDWIVNLPWTKRTEDKLDLVNAREILDKHHYGLDEIKERVLEYLAVMKLKQEQGQAAEFMRSPILCFVGLVGTGKTTIAYSIAEAMGRNIARIPFGGMEDALDLRGQSRMHAEAEPGKVIKALRVAGSKNPVILLDEIDRVTDAGRASIMGVLVELLDPNQNSAYVDHYIDYPVDLSQCLFIATANNTTHIATAVLDRLEPIMMPSYSDQEKITIGKQYILPKVLVQTGVSADKIIFDEDVWINIVRPLGFDSGIRTLERTVEGIVRKVAREMVEGKSETVHLTKDNVKQYLPQW